MGLNFTDEGEAEVFQNAVVEKISQRNNRQGQKDTDLFYGDNQIVMNAMSLCLICISDSTCMNRTSVFIWGSNESDISCKCMFKYLKICFYAKCADLESFG